MCLASYILLCGLGKLLALPAQHRLARGGSFIEPAAGRQARGAAKAGGLAGARFQRHFPQHMDETVERFPGFRFW